MIFFYLPTDYRIPITYHCQLSPLLKLSRSILCLLPTDYRIPITDYCQLSPLHPFTRYHVLTLSCSHAQFFAYCLLITEYRLPLTAYFNPFSRIHKCLNPWSNFIIFSFTRIVCPLPWNKCSL